MPNAGWQRVKRGPGWIVLAVVVAALMAVGVGRGAVERSPEQRIEDISKRLACPICDGESVFDSRNPTSDALRTEIRAQVQAGVATDDEIITFIQQRFGESVLLVPRAEGVDALVWILPVVVAVLAVGGLAFAFRRWQRNAGGRATDDDRALVEQARREGLDTADSPYDDRRDSVPPGGGHVERTDGEAEVEAEPDEPDEGVDGERDR